ncbi:MAG: ABC transporter substrate-binding protein, partial [Chitinophagaceae bacterium]
MIRLYKYLTLCYVVFLSACYSTEKENPNIFHYNESSGVANLDPAFAKSQSVMWVAHQLYNTLVEVDSQLHIVPSLATRWEVSADRKN